MKTLNVLDDEEVKMLEESLTFFLLNQSFASYEDAKPYADLVDKLRNGYKGTK